MLFVILNNWMNKYKYKENVHAQPLANSMVSVRSAVDAGLEGSL